MKISVFMAHIQDAAQQTGFDTLALLQHYRACGIEAVELDIPHIPQILRLLEQSGLSCACVNGHYQLTDSFPDAAVTEHIRAARIAGADKILIVPGYLSAGSEATLKAAASDYSIAAELYSNNQEILSMADSLKRICAMAQDEGLSVVIEDFDHPLSPLCSLNGLRWFLDNITNLSCNFDTGNFITFNEEIPAAWELLKHRVKHIHCKDRADTPVAVGSGVLPIKAFLQSVTLSGYDGYLAIEHYGADHQHDCIRSSAAFLQECLVACHK